MESLSLLADGFAGALTLSNLFWVVAGCLLGTAVGVIPGSAPPWPWRCCCP